jgi:hypothetical protein
MKSCVRDAAVIGEIVFSTPSQGAAENFAT